MGFYQRIICIMIFLILQMLFCLCLVVKAGVYLEFHSVAMGKHSVTLNASGYKQWANEENSVLVNPSGKVPVYDGMFFHEGQPYNQVISMILKKMPL